MEAGEAFIATNGEGARPAAARAAANALSDSVVEHGQGCGAVGKAHGNLAPAGAPRIGCAVPPYLAAPVGVPDHGEVRAGDCRREKAKRQNRDC